MDKPAQARAAPDTEMAVMGGRQMLEETPSDPAEPVEVECHVWYDLDGNPCAWSPVGSGVISVEIGEPDKDAPVEVYQALKDAERKAKSAEERIAELEAMVARLAARIADETG
jgi:hypothetical protein